MSEHPTYMDYPFLCDEKLGERCIVQCQTCKEADQKRQQKWREERENSGPLTVSHDIEV